MNTPVVSKVQQGGAPPQPLPARRQNAGIAAALGWLRSKVTSLPPLMRVGFAVLAGAIVADVAYHAIHGLHPHTHGGALDVPTAIHLTAAAGMLITLTGLVTAGIRSTRRHNHHKEEI